MPEPAANGSVGNRGVMQDDEGRHHAAQAIDVEVALGHEPIVRGAVSAWSAK